MYVWDEVGPVLVVPSPKAHWYVVTVPSASDEPEPSKVHTAPEHDEVNAATGLWLAGGATAVTARFTVPVAPLSSLTVKVTVYAPASVYVC